jgi:hypothetical protein
MSIKTKSLLTFALIFLMRRTSSSEEEFGEKQVILPTPVYETIQRSAEEEIVKLPLFNFSATSEPLSEEQIKQIFTDNQISKDFGYKDSKLHGHVYIKTSDDYKTECGDNNQKVSYQINYDRGSFNCSRKSEFHCIENLNLKDFLETSYEECEVMYGEYLKESNVFFKIKNIIPAVNIQDITMKENLTQEKCAEDHSFNMKVYTINLEFTLLKYNAGYSCGWIIKICQNQELSRNDHLIQNAKDCQNGYDAFKNQLDNEENEKILL